jgi:hypothetical protein
MTQSPSQPSPIRRDSYSQQTHRPLVCLIFIAPLLLFFQIGAMFCRTSLLAPEDLGRLLGYFGATAPYLPPLFILAVLFSQHLLKKDDWHLRPTVLAGMVGESMIWTIPLIALNMMASHLELAATTVRSNTAHVFQETLVAVGAGIYEEFIFRLVLVIAAILIFVDVFGLNKKATAVAAIVVGAFLFSLYHFPADQWGSGMPFPWADFLFRAAAGVYLGGLFILRGFGLAVGTHTFFNLYVIWMHIH